MRSSTVARKASSGPSEDPNNILVARNRKARFKYELLDRYEAGLALKGSEIKSIRGRAVTLDQGFGRIVGRELFVFGVNIAQYDKGGYVNHEPTRPRKLLLHRRQIEEIMARIGQPGYTLVPTALYLKRGLAKMEVAIARGKRQHDKRESIKRRESDRQIKRALARVRRQ